MRDGDAGAYTTLSIPLPQSGTWSPFTVASRMEPLVQMWINGCENRATGKERETYRRCRRHRQKWRLVCGSFGTNCHKHGALWHSSRDRQRQRGSKWTTAAPLCRLRKEAYFQRVAVSTIQTVREISAVDSLGTATKQRQGRHDYEDYCLCATGTG